MEKTLLIGARDHEIQVIARFVRSRPISLISERRAKSLVVSLAVSHATISTAPGTRLLPGGAARLLAVDAGAGRHGFHLDVVLDGLLMRLLDLLLRAERSGPDITDETRTSVLRPVAALQREVPVGHVLRRIRGQRLIPLNRRALLLHFHVAKDGDQHHEHDEAHAATHDQTEPSREDTRNTTSVAHRAVAHYRIGRVQSSDLRAPTGGRIHHHGQRGPFDHVVVRRIPLPGTDIFRDWRTPAAQSEYADEVTRVRRQLGQSD